MKTQFDTITFTAPSAWASYLINGDASGLDEQDKEDCDRWIMLNRLGDPVSCENAGFIHRHDAFAVCPLGADCQTYAFLVPIE